MSTVKKRKKKKSLLGPVLVLVLSLALLAGAVWLLLSPDAPVFTLDQPISAGADDTQPETEPTVPAFRVAATGNTQDVRFAESYTVSSDRAGELGAKSVAALGSHTLTNAELQVLYLQQIGDCLTPGDTSRPDLSRPLEDQEWGNGLSWQHHLLENALKAWAMEVIASDRAAQPIPVTEEAWQPIEGLREQYIAPELPVNSFLYADRDCYTPNKLHQAWLDSLPAALDDLARSLGYADGSDYARKVFACDADTVTASARLQNLAYMYLTELGFDWTNDDASEASVSGSGTVDIRHALLIPNGARIAADGTVTADEDAWNRCRLDAQLLLNSWKNDWLTAQNPDSNFARLANRESADEGSALNGGLYAGIRRGQLICELDDWAFAADRKPGDTELIRTALGWHIVYLSAAHGPEYDPNSTLARNMQDLLLKQFGTGSASEVLTPDYSAAALWVDPGAAALNSGSLLYPDIAHERFPEAITYLQQDYYYHPYGPAYVGGNGCGITTFAMLATYMSDTLCTPAMMADAYGSYSVTYGTNGDLFRNAPADLGFFPDQNSGDMDVISKAIANGQVAVVLEQKGHFTGGGHYLLIQDHYPATDEYQVRDSNIYNYKKLSGHAIDRFTRQDIMSGLNGGYIMQKKVVRIPACSRCGDTFDQRQPELLLNDSYTCPRCLTALARRNSFLKCLSDAYRA